MIIFICVIDICPDTLWIHATTRIFTLTSSLLYYLIIPIAIAASYFLLGEAMTTSKIFGAVLIVCANLLGLFSQMRRKVIVN